MGVWAQSGSGQGKNGAKARQQRGKTGQEDEKGMKDVDKPCYTTGMGEQTKGYVMVEGRGRERRRKGREKGAERERESERARGREGEMVVGEDGERGDGASGKGVARERETPRRALSGRPWAG